MGELFIAYEPGVRGRETSTAQSRHSCARINCGAIFLRNGKLERRSHGPRATPIDRTN